MPIDYREYHPDWKQISRQIRDQAGDRCEWCGVANKAYGARDRFGEWHDEVAIHNLNSSDGMYLFDEFPNMIRIVLTVAHLCNEKACIDPTHLRALCQRCHLNYDRDHHIANAAETRRRRIVERGQQELFA